MADPYIGEIRAFGFNWAPQDWAFCNGQSMAVQQNQALYAVISTRYGGTAGSSFNLPNLQGKVPMHWGPAPAVPGAVQVNTGLGQVAVGLTTSQVPPHVHTMSGATGANGAMTTPPGPSSMLFRPITGTAGFYAWSSTAKPTSQLSPSALGSVGAATVVAHENRQPFLVLNFCICLSGIFPVPAQ